MTKSTDPIQLQERLDFIGIDATAKATLRKLKPFVQKDIGPSLDTFYERSKIGTGDKSPLSKSATHGPCQGKAGWALGRHCWS